MHYGGWCSRCTLYVWCFFHFFHPTVFGSVWDVFLTTKEIRYLLLCTFRVILLSNHFSFLSATSLFRSFYTILGGCLFNVIVFWFCWEDDCVDSYTTLSVWASSLSTLQDSSSEESDWAESLDNDDVQVPVHSFRLCPSLPQVARLSIKSCQIKY